MNTEQPLVSVCTISYNHEKYIERAIQGVIDQRYNFKVEFIIGDDCSKDGTRDIIRRYQAQYPDLIFPLFPEKNLGARQNAMQTMKRCRGKYIAFLEGDDFWTDPTKLQRLAHTCMPEGVLVVFVIANIRPALGSTGITGFYVFIHVHYFAYPVHQVFVEFLIVRSLRYTGKVHDLVCPQDVAEFFGKIL